MEVSTGTSVPKFKSVCLIIRPGEHDGRQMDERTWMEGKTMSKLLYLLLMQGVVTKSIRECVGHIFSVVKLSRRRVVMGLWSLPSDRGHQELLPRS